MTDVVIAGIGQTEVGEHWDIGLRELAYAAMQDALNGREVRNRAALRNPGSIDEALRRLPMTDEPLKPAGGPA